MKKQLKGIAIGILVITLLVGTTTVLGNPMYRQLTVRTTSTNLIVNGNIISSQVMDNRGNMLEPLLIDGNVYLPAGALANALGMDVRWDSATSTLYLTSRVTAMQPVVQPVAPQPQPPVASVITTPQPQAPIAPVGLLMDFNGLRVTFLGFSDWRYGDGVQMDMFLENNSAFNYIVSIHDVYINGMGGVFPSFGSGSVSAGRNLYDRVVLMDEWLAASRITAVREIEFRLDVIDTSDFSRVFTSEVITILR